MKKKQSRSAFTLRAFTTETLYEPTCTAAFVVPRVLAVLLK